MRVCHSISAAFDDPNLIASAGLVPVMALAQNAGLSALVGEHVGITVRAQDLRPHRSGAQFDVVAELRTEDSQELAWTGTSTYLARGVRLPEAEKAEQASRPEFEAPLPTARTLVDEPHHGRVGGNTDPAIGGFFGDQIHRRGVGQGALKAPTAWFTSATRLARNSTRLHQWARSSKSTSAITVRVLPAPVAITTSARRCCSRSKVSAMRRMARCW